MSAMVKPDIGQSSPSRLPSASPTSVLPPLPSPPPSPVAPTAPTGHRGGCVSGPLCLPATTSATKGVTREPGFQSQQQHHHHHSSMDGRAAPVHPRPSGAIRQVIPAAASAAGQVPRDPHLGAVGQVSGQETDHARAFRGRNASWSSDSQQEKALEEGKASGRYGEEWEELAEELRDVVAEMEAECNGWLRLLVSAVRGVLLRETAGLDCSSSSGGGGAGGGSASGCSSSRSSSCSARGIDRELLIPTRCVPSAGCACRAQANTCRDTAHVGSSISNSSSGSDCGSGLGNSSNSDSASSARGDVGCSPCACPFVDNRADKTSVSASASTSVSESACAVGMRGVAVAEEQQGLRQAIAAELQARGYDAAVCWSHHDGCRPRQAVSSRHRHTVHSFVDVLIWPDALARPAAAAPPQAEAAAAAARSLGSKSAECALARQVGGQVASATPACRVVVDMEFRAQFLVARPAAPLAAMLERLPAAVVCREGLLRRAVAVLAEAVRLSLEQQGMPVPPWRRAVELRARWSSSRTPPLQQQQWQKQAVQQDLQQQQQQVLLQGAYVGFEVKEGEAAALATRSQQKGRVIRAEGSSAASALAAGRFSSTDRPEKGAHLDTLCTVAGMATEILLQPIVSSVSMPCLTSTAAAVAAAQPKLRRQVSALALALSREEDGTEGSLERPGLTHGVRSSTGGAAVGSGAGASGRKTDGWSQWRGSAKQAKTQVHQPVVSGNRRVPSVQERVTGRRVSAPVLIAPVR